MLHRKNLLTITAALVLTLFVSSLRADDSGPSITAIGHATTPQKPEILRMTLMISAQGTDIHDALAKMKSKSDDLSAKLIAASADKASIKFVGPGTGDEGNLTVQQRMMQQMMARNQRPASTQPSGVTISSTL